MPHHFNVPTMEAHDGTTDSFDHLESFRFLMLFHRASDALMCKSLLTSSREAMRAWYT